MKAVEWLADEIIMLEEKLRLEEININDFMDAKDELVSKALEMEKEQTMDFAMKFMMQDRPIVSFYNETFKSKQDEEQTRA